MRTRTLGWGTAALGALSAILIGGGLAMPAGDVPTAYAQATETVTSTTTTTATTTATTSATATTTTATAATTTATASPTATPTATQVPPTATPTTIAPTQVPTQPSNAPLSLTLSGANEVPAVTSSGTGKFLGTATSTSLSYTLTASGTASGITMAHIHSGAAGSNGPIVADLITPGSGVASINQSGTITVANLKGPMAGDMAAFMAALRAGTLYVNVHTVANPGGELRAQFPAPPGPPSTGDTASQASGIDSGMLLAAGALAGVGALAFGLGLVGRRRRA
jgi:hypothetical protein